MLILKLGDSGAEVKQLQEKLKEANFDPGIPDGVFGAGTEAAVKAFQKSEGLDPDGVAGPRTLTKLGVIPAPSAPSPDRQAWRGPWQHKDPSARRARCPVRRQAWRSGDGADGAGHRSRRDRRFRADLRVHLGLQHLT